MVALERERSGRSIRPRNWPPSRSASGGARAGGRLFAGAARGGAGGRSRRARRARSRARPGRAVRERGRHARGGANPRRPHAMGKRARRAADGLLAHATAPARRRRAGDGGGAAWRTDAALAAAAARAPAPTTTRRRPWRWRSRSIPTTGRAFLGLTRHRAARCRAARHRRSVPDARAACERAHARGLAMEWRWCWAAIPRFISPPRSAPGATRTWRSPARSPARRSGSGECRRASAAGRGRDRHHRQDRAE